MIHTLYLLGLQFAPDLFSFGLVSSQHLRIKDHGSRTLDLRILFSGRKILQPLDVLYYNIISIEASAGSAIMQRATVVGWRYVVLGSRPLWQM